MSALVATPWKVTSRMGRVSRNSLSWSNVRKDIVTSRMGRVSRNDIIPDILRI